MKFVKKSDASKITVFALLIIVVYTIFNISPWKKAQVIDGDTISYYAYLPAVFIHQDISLSFIDKDPAAYSNKFWPSITPDHAKVIKTTMGMSLLYLPFFLIAHLYAYLFGYTTDGFSLPYQVLLIFSSAFYLFIGLLFLRKALRFFFSDFITALTLISLVLGTNLFCYITLGATMSHTYNFAIIAVFVYYVIRWYKNPEIKYAIFIGLLTGLLALIRPTNALVFIFFIAFGIQNIHSIKNRFKLFKKKKEQILILFVCAVIVVIPQLLYWNYITGSFFFNSYVNEHFFFNHPHIMEGLFGYRKGWLVYTPIMILSLFGFIFIYKRYRDLFLSLLIFTIVNIYVILSWWCWWYGGGFGLRAFIDSYAILAFPLAAFYVVIFEGRRKLVKFLFYFVVVFFIALNLFQTFQYKRGKLHYDSMTKDLYWAIFLRWEYPKNGDALLKAPDYDKALKGMDE